MARDDRFYPFIISHTFRSRSRIRRINIEKKVVRIVSGICVAIVVTLAFGLYGLTQHASHLRTMMENERLRSENNLQNQQLEKLNNRVEKVEDTSRKLAEKSGVVDHSAVSPGRGGPE